MNIGPIPLSVGDPTNLRYKWVFSDGSLGPETGPTGITQIGGFNYYYVTDIAPSTAVRVILYDVTDVTNSSEVDLSSHELIPFTDTTCPVDRVPGAGSLSPHGLFVPPSFSDQFDVFIQQPLAVDYVLGYSMKFEGNIGDLTVECDTGSATVSLKINDVAVTGLDGVLINQNKTTYAASGLNSFNPGDKITLSITQLTNCQNLHVTSGFTRSRA